MRSLLGWQVRNHLEFVAALGIPAHERFVHALSVFEGMIALGISGVDVFPRREHEDRSVEGQLGKCSFQRVPVHRTSLVDHGDCFNGRSVEEDPILGAGHRIVLVDVSAKNLARELFRLRSRAQARGSTLSNDGPS